MSRHKDVPDDVKSKLSGALKDLQKEGMDKMKLPTLLSAKQHVDEALSEQKKGHPPKVSE